MALQLCSSVDKTAQQVFGDKLGQKLTPIVEDIIMGVKGAQQKAMEYYNQLIELLADKSTVISNGLHLPKFVAQNKSFGKLVSDLNLGNFEGNLGSAPQAVKSVVDQIAVEVEVADVKNDIDMVEIEDETPEQNGEPPTTENETEEKLKEINAKIWEEVKQQRDQIQAQSGDEAVKLTGGYFY